MKEVDDAQKRIDASILEMQKIIEKAIIENDMGTLDFYLDYCKDRNFTNQEGLTLLHLAVKENNLEATKLLISKGVDPRIKVVKDKHRRGMNALHFGAESDNAEICDFLIRDGLSIHEENNLAMTPLHIACINGCNNVVDLLIRNHGDDPSKTFYFPYIGTVNSFTIAMKHDKIITAELLIELGYKPNESEKNNLEVKKRLLAPSTQTSEPSCEKILKFLEIFQS